MTGMLDLLERVGDKGITLQRLFSRKSITALLDIEIAIHDALDLDPPPIDLSVESWMRLTQAGVAVRANRMELNMTRRGMPSAPLSSCWLTLPSAGGYIVPEHLPKRYREMIGELFQDELAIVPSPQDRLDRVKTDRIRSQHIAADLDRRLRRIGDDRQIVLRIRNADWRIKKPALTTELAVAALLVDGDIQRLRAGLPEGTQPKVVVESSDAFGEALVDTLRKRLTVDILEVAPDDAELAFDADGEEPGTRLTF